MSMPDIRGRLDRKQFESEDHAVFGTDGSGFPISDQELARKGIGGAWCSPSRTFSARRS